MRSSFVNIGFKVVKIGRPPLTQIRDCGEDHLLAPGKQFLSPDMGDPGIHLAL